MSSVANRIADLASVPLFHDAEEDEVFLNNPYRRPTRTFDNQFINFASPLNRNNQASNSALSTHRLLLNVYEMDMLFLPDQSYPGFAEDFATFYSEDALAKADAVRHDLEKKAFGFLDDEIQIEGKWTAKDAMEFFEAFLHEQKQSRDLGASSSAVLNAIMTSPDPKRCAQHYLIQFAPDFLSEASAMSRMASGMFGPLQSEVFNILIDEYGAGVHDNKHSTLYENTMKSVGLSSQIHHYWQFYQATSLCMTNYFHYITRAKRHAFRYLGALLYTEASLVNVTKRQSEMLRTVFGKDVDTKYFDEHHHIDQHHGEMALHRVIKPALDRFGDDVASEIVRGFLEFQFLESLADEDLVAQLEFFNSLEQSADLAKRYYHEVVGDGSEIPLETFVECKGERSTTHTHPDDRLLVIESGSMEFWPIYGDALSLSAGDILAIPRHRLHGSVVTSDESVYHQPIADRDTMLAALDNQVAAQ